MCALCGGSGIVTGITGVSEFCDNCTAFDDPCLIHLPVIDVYGVFDDATADGEETNDE
jgi:hypothetical protein